MIQTVTEPLVSVLIPLYNHAGFVKRCLDSVLEDGYPRIEIIMVDDGSRDDSVAVAQQWFKQMNSRSVERFEIESRPNKGVTRTLNELVNKARGDYLVLLASDDFLLQGGISARLEYLQRHPDKLAVFGDCIVVDDTGVKTNDSAIVGLYGGHIECLKDDKMMALELIYRWCVTGPGFMARRELYDQIGYYDESLTVEDWDMYLRAASIGALGFIPGPVAAYRSHGENSVRKPGARIAQLDSLKRTAWKNFQGFNGLHRLGLLYRYFKLNKEIASFQGKVVKSFVNKLICMPFSIVSNKRYKKIVKNFYKQSSP